MRSSKPNNFPIQFPIPFPSPLLIPLPSSPHSLTHSLKPLSPFLPPSHTRPQIHPLLLSRFPLPSPPTPKPPHLPSPFPLFKSSGPKLIGSNYTQHTQLALSPPKPPSPPSSTPPKRSPSPRNRAKTHLLKRPNNTIPILVIHEYRHFQIAEFADTDFWIASV